MLAGICLKGTRKLQWLRQNPTLLALCAWSCKLHRLLATSPRPTLHAQIQQLSKHVPSSTQLSTVRVPTTGFASLKRRLIQHLAGLLTPDFPPCIVNKKTSRRPVCWENLAGAKLSANTDSSLQGPSDQIPWLCQQVFVNGKSPTSGRCLRLGFELVLFEKLTLVVVEVFLLETMPHKHILKTVHCRWSIRPEESWHSLAKCPVASK